MGSELSAVALRGRCSPRWGLLWFVDDRVGLRVVVDLEVCSLFDLQSFGKFGWNEKVQGVSDSLYLTKID